MPVATGPTRVPKAPLIGVWLLASAACSLLLLAIGCGPDEAPPGEQTTAPRQAGPFEATVRGAVTDTLRGEAVARLDSAGRLVGFELDDRADTTQAGLSFELPAQEPGAARSYTVAPRDEGGREDTSFALMNTYLRVRGHEFAARAGSLRVDRDSSGLSGVFGLRLRGMIEPASDEASVVEVGGHFGGVQPGGAPAQAAQRP